MTRAGIVNEFLELVQIDVISKGERAIADVLIQKLIDIGCSVYEDDTGKKIGGTAGNLYAVLDGTREGAILFSAHMDRVENGCNIKPQLIDGRILSDGNTILAADDISGIVAILDGLRRIQNNKTPHPTIEILFTVCEEIGVCGSKYVDYSRLKSQTAFVLDSPGRIGRVINKAPSKARLSCTVKGKAAHAGNEPEKGINAVIAAAKLLSRLRDGRLDEMSTANWAEFDASGPLNVVNDSACISGEARSGEVVRLDAYIKEFYEACFKAEMETGAIFTPQAEWDYQGFDIPDDHPSIRLMKRVFEKLNIQMQIERGGGGMDANRFNANGITAIGLATGYTKNHSVDENIVIQDLIQSGEMVENIIRLFLF